MEDYTVATFTSNSPEETEAFGRQIATEVRPGLVLALKGDLGAGKTQFVKGLVRGLNSSAPVTSPTFTLIHEYPDGQLPVYHCDLFRVEDAISAERLGLDEFFFSGGVSVVEWADKFPQLIPGTARWISFEIVGENRRLITS